VISTKGGVPCAVFDVKLYKHGYRAEAEHKRQVTAYCASLSNEGTPMYGGVLQTFE
jgi:hypothetical protein